MLSSSIMRRAVHATARRRVAVANITKCTSVFQSSFSTAPQQEDDDTVLFIPPNLSIDRRSSASPFHGLQTLAEEKSALSKIEETITEDESDTPIEVEETDADVDDDDDEDEDDVDGEEGEYYSLSNKLEPLYAIPLPERLHVPILDFKSASESGTIHLSEDVFGQDPIRTDILHRCVIYQRNKKRGRRNGGARTKTIGEVSGSGKKVRNQKGGGIARAGHKRPAHWRGGAKAHGPKGSIQNYETKLNKKVRKIGLRMALSQKLKEGNLIIVNSFSDVGTYKTKVLAKTLLDIADIGGKFGSSAYIVDHVVDNEDEDDEEALITSLEGCDINLKVGCANIMRTKVTNQRNVNVYDLLKYDKTVMSLSALAEIEDRYGAI
jgi:large subunit ribosomal protein L4